MKTTLFLLLTTITVIANAQQKIHSINLNFPSNRLMNSSRPYDLGVTFNLENKDYRFFTRLSAYGPNDDFNFGTGYFDSSSNSFRADRRLRFQIPLEDSLETVQHRVTYSGFGVRLGIEKEYTFLSIPIQTNLFLGLYGRKSNYQSDKFFTIYTNEPILGVIQRDEPGYETNFPWDEFERAEKWTLSPQLGTSVGIVLKANDRFSVVPSLTATITHLHRYTFTLGGPYREGNSLDLNVNPMLQLNYLLKPERTDSDKSRFRLRDRLKKD